MSVISHARSELGRIGFGAEDTEVMIDILERFFARWDSGAAVWAVAPVLQRLIAAKPLSPLTGEDDEWIDHGDGVFQNKRMASVFKDPRFHEGKLAYDAADPVNPTGAITFPYLPKWAQVESPVIAT